MKTFSLIGLALASVLAASVVPGARAGEVSGCDPDFNNDGQVNAGDVADYLSVSAGADPCRPGGPEEPVEPVCCDTIDVNGNGVFPEDADLLALQIMVAGGPCPTTGFTPITQSGPRLRVQPGETIASVYQRLQWSGGVVEIPWSSRDQGIYTDTIRWPDQDGLPYGNVTFVGVPGPQGQRPLIVVPGGAGGTAGARINASNIRIHGIAFDVSRGAIGVDVQGDVTGILIEDCEIRGGVIGVQVAGPASWLSTVRVRRNIITDQRSPPGIHSQGMYVASGHTLVAEDNAFINCGNRDIYSHGMYLVHNRECKRIITGNWIISPGGAGIQARGGEYFIDRNVVAWADTFIGTGHPMAFDAVNASKTVWTSAVVSSNVMADAREDAPAKWGGCYMLGKPTVWRDNAIIGIARPWMSSTDQSLSVPVGEVTRVGNVVKPARSGEDWASTARERRTRKVGTWESERWDVDSLRERVSR